MSRHLQSLLFAVLTLLVLSARISAAQSPSINSATATPVSGHWQVDIQLSDSLATDPGTCKVVDLTHNLFLTVASCAKTPLGTMVELQLDAKEIIDPKAAYIVALENLTFSPADSGPTRPVKILEGEVTIPGAPSAVAATSEAAAAPPPHVPCFLGRFGQLFKAKGIGKSDGRDDSNLYFSGQVTHSRGKDFVGTYDTKLDFTGHCELANTDNLIGPTFDLKGGNDPNASPDSLNFGFLWEFPVIKASHVISSIRLTQNAKLESTQDFTQRNFIYGADLRGVFKSWIWSHPAMRARIRPVVGTEVGKNLHGIIPAVDGRNIARLKAGTGLFLIFEFNKPALQDIQFETSYARRWPLIDEVTYTHGTNGLSAVSIGTNPRDYVKQTMTIDVTKFLGVNVAYEYGSLPPLYKFLDSKFTFGLDVKMKFGK